MFRCLRDSHSRRLRLPIRLVTQIALRSDAASADPASPSVKVVRAEEVTDLTTGDTPVV